MNDNASIREHILGEETVFNGLLIKVNHIDVELPNGKKAKREAVCHNGGAGIVAVDADENIYMVRQHRVVVDEVTLEIPAGKLEYGEDPETCGRRELLEECGCTAASFAYLGKLYPTPAYNTEVIHIYLAKDLQFAAQHLDEGEFLDVERVSLQEAVRMVLANEIPDAKTQVAILRYLALQK